MLQYLIHTFGYNQPFSISEIEYKDFSRTWKYNCIVELCQKGEVVHLERDVYYVPKKNKFGIVPFDPMKIIEKKYINDNENVQGYYSGKYLLYQLGISKVKPKTIEIYSNSETQRSKVVNISGKRLLLHKPRTKIDKHSAPVLCFLELMNGIDTETLDEYKRKLITDYITDNRITQRQITKYIPYFPDKTCRNLNESEVIYRVPQ